MKPSELRQWREAHSYTLKSLGEILGVTKMTVYRWEKGMREIPSFLHLALRGIEKGGDDISRRIGSGEVQGKRKRKGGE